MKLRIPRAYVLWESRQEPDLIEPGTRLSAWLATSVVLYALVLACRALGELPGRTLWTALAVPAPVVVEGVVVAILRRRGQVPWRIFLACNVIGSALLTFTFASLALLASGRASFLFVAFVALTAGLHSWNTKSSIEAPVIGIAAVLGIALAVLVTASRDILLVGMMMVLGLYLSLMMGTWAARAHARLATHREALQAKLLGDHASRIGTMNSSLTRMLSLMHDQRNLAQAISLELADLDEVVLHPDAREVVDGIATTFEHLRELLAAVPTDVEKDRPASDTIAVFVPDVVADVMRVVECRYRGVQSHVAVSHHVPLAAVCGGALSLYRVLMNLLLNACEGDGGAKKATLIRLVAERDKTGRLIVIRVSDNGPGFPEAILHRRVPFHSSKADGSGLGLLTAETHVRASGGEIRYANLMDGGGEVTVELPVAGS